MSNGFNVLKKFVKWQQSVNNGFCTHMWLQNPLFKLCYHLTSFFVKTKKCHLPFTLELSSFERTFLFYYNVNPVIRKWQHRILLTSSFMLEKFPSHSASPRGLESFLAFMTRWVKSYVVISSSQDWYIVKSKIIFLYSNNMAKNSFCTSRRIGTHSYAILGNI